MSVRRRLAAVVAAGAVAGIAYALVASRAVQRFAARAPDREPPEPPAVSLLIPLHGAEPGLAENLRAFLHQRYPAPVQVVLGVATEGDPALAVARAAAAAAPGVDVAFSFTAAPGVRNPKVANLLAMSALARYGTLVSADSDMRVDGDYLRAVTAPLGDRAVGAVTCLYGAIPAGGAVTELGAMHVVEQFAPSVLVAAAAGPLRHCFGATIALRRDVLEATGGFAALGAHLADDNALGAAIAARGLRIVLSRYVPQTISSDRSLAALWRHEVRWLRTIRALQPAGYAGLFVTYPLALALIALALAPRSRAARLAAVAAFAVRLHLRRAAAVALGTRLAPWWYVPLRDLLGLAVWARALGGGELHWRDAELRLGRGDVLGKLGAADG